MKSSVLILGVLICFMVGVVGAEVNFDIVYPDLDIEVIEDTYFNFSVNVSCSETDCGDIEVSLRNPILEEVEYYHDNVSGATESDCFDGTCLTMELRDSVFNLSGDQLWGCGKCNEVSFWESNLKNMNPNCVSGMRNVPGVDLCFVADNGNEWDLVFSKWSSAGSSEFEYTRIRYGGILVDEDSSGDNFYVDGDNPRVVNLSEGELELVIFSVKASGIVGTDSDFVLFVGNESSEEINVKIIEEEDEDEDEAESDPSSSHTRSSSYEEDNYYENLIEEEFEEPVVSGVQVLAVSDVSKDNDSDNIFPIILIGLIGLLVVAIFVLLLARK